MMQMSVPQYQMMHDAGVGLRLRRLSEAEPPPDPCVPDPSLTSPPLTSERASSSSSASVSLASPDLGVTQLTSRRQRSDRSPVGASLQEMYGLVSNRAKDPNDKVSRLCHGYIPGLSALESMYIIFIYFNVGFVI